MHTALLMGRISSLTCVGALAIGAYACGTASDAAPETSADAGSSVDGAASDTSAEDAAADAATADAARDAASADAAADSASGSDGGAADGSDAGGIVPCAPAPATTKIEDAKQHGAVGDGQADDTAAIQATIDALGAAGGTAFIPAGTYRIDVNANLPGTGRPYGIGLKSNVTLRLDPKAVLQVITNSLGAYALVAAYSISNASVVGGTLVGDKHTHTGTTGEWGFGIDIRSSTNIAVDGVTSKSMWGDGLLVKTLSSVQRSSGIQVCNSVFDDNRRQGLTATDVNGMVIRDSVFQNTGGTWPMAGIDFEPDQNETVESVQVLRSQFIGNKGSGMVMTVAPDQAHASSFVKNVTIQDNVMTRNGTPGGENSFGPIDGIEVLNTSGHTIKGNTITQSVYDGIGLRSSSKDITVSGNTVRSNGRYGILIDNKSTANTISGNDVCGNPTGQIHDAVGTSTVSGNTVNAVCK